MQLEKHANILTEKPGKRCLENKAESSASGLKTFVFFHSYHLVSREIPFSISLTFIRKAL